MARGLAWLKDQAVRLRRTRWNADLLADELWLMLQSLEPASTGRIAVDGGDDQDPLDDINIPPIDVGFPDEVTTPEQDVSDNGTTVTERTYYWDRTAVPVVVGSEVTTIIGGGTGVWNVTAYPNGNLVSLATSTRRSTARTVPLTATLIAGEVADGDNALVVRIVELLEEKTTIREDGKIVQQETELSVVQAENFLYGFAAGAQQAYVAQVTVNVSSRSGASPGSGVASFYEIGQLGTLSLVSVGNTVYNMTGSTINVGEVIQVKRIGSNWFVDVQDCSSSGAIS